MSGAGITPLFLISQVANRRDSRRQRSVSLNSSGSFGYARGLRYDKWGIPVEGFPGGAVVVFYGWSWMS